MRDIYRLIQTIHRTISGLQVAVGVAVVSLGTMASSSASHAAGNGKEMAHPGVSFLLALEVEERKWAAPDSEGNAKSD